MTDRDHVRTGRATVLAGAGIAGAIAAGAAVLVTGDKPVWIGAGAGLGFAVAALVSNRR